LNGQLPPEQPPVAQALGAGQAPEAQGAAPVAATAALKVENCFSSFFAPHCGHAPGAAALRLISFSIVAPHARHRYS